MLTIIKIGQWVIYALRAKELAMNYGSGIKCSLHYLILNYKQLSNKCAYIPIHSEIQTPKKQLI